MPRRLQIAASAGGAVAVGIHDGGAALRQQALEQPRLGREVGVHRGVIVEMLVRQVGEAGGGELQAVEAMLVETVARRLDRKMRDALARQGREILVELHRIGRGEAGVARQPRRDDAERADARGLEAKRLPRSGARSARSRTCRWCR